MKSFLFSTVLSLCFLSATAQNVAINNDGSAPDPKAQLDVKSANKGVLFPRITDLSAITGSVPLGLLVFVTDGDRGFYYNASGLAGTPNWKKISSGDDAYWQYASPNYLYWNGAANVGIGIATPQAKLHVSGAMAEKLRLENTTVLAADVNNEMYFKTGAFFTNAIKSIGTGSNTARLGLFGYAANTSGAMREYLSILDGGNVGIGTPLPLTKLHVRSDQSDNLILDNSNTLNTGVKTEMYFKAGTYYTAAIKTTGLGTATSRLGFYTAASQNGTALAEQLSISDDGNVGIGTINPAKGKLVISAIPGNVSALFGETVNGVAIENNWPGVAFNSYFSAGRKAIATGYGSVIGQNPGNGDIYIQSSMASITAGAAMPTPTRLLIDKDGDIGVEGNTAPHAPLSFANTAGSKISLYGSSETSNYGLGIQGFLMQLYTDASNADIAFGYGGSAPANFVENMRIKGNGRVGIGTNAPSEQFDVDGNMRVRGGGVWFDGSTTPNRVFLGMADNNTIGIYSSALNYGFRYDASDGTLRLGTPQKASGYLLNIGGKAIAEEVRVQLRASWPDYVFKKNYSLMPLSKLEAFIQQNNHLPNIPKAEVLEDQGTDLGEMQRRMMEKIEELTLYVIDQNKKIEAQQQEIDRLKQKAKH